MTDLFAKAPEIIREAAQSSLGIAALIILVVSVIAISFFKKAGEKTRRSIFICIIIGFLCFGLAIIIIVTPRDKKVPSATTSSTTASSPAGPQPAVTSSSPSPGPTVRPICPSLEIKIIQRFPYYLINTFKNNRENQYIYWAVLAGVNDCQDPKPVEVRFAVRNKTVAQATDIPWKRTFKVGEKISRLSIDPQFEFLQRVENTTLEVIWEIKDQNTNMVFASNTDRIQVISENYVDWNLKDQEGKRVPMDFLMASLTAWSLDPDEVIRTQAQKYLPGDSAPANAAEASRQWFRLCYEDLFQSPAALKIQPLSTPWPPLKSEELDSTEKIKTPAEIIQAKKGNSLEGALLMAALRNGAAGRMGSRLCLFVIPKMEDFFTGAKQFILAWSVNGSEWSGIDLTDPNKINFNDNESSTSAKLNNFLKTRSYVLSALYNQGVFVDDNNQILAIDFDNAPKNKKFNIGGLPHKKL